MSPIHYLAEDMISELNEPEPRGWYFWSETWTDRYGPFESQELAEAACARYVKDVLNGGVE